MIGPGDLTGPEAGAMGPVVAFGILIFFLFGWYLLSFGGVADV